MPTETESPVTLVRIAQHVGMSRISVVRALNGHPGVRPETRRRVIEAARELGYSEQTNPEARAMAARRHNRRLRHGVVAVLLAKDFHDSTLRHLPFYTSIFQGIEEAAARLGSEICLLPLNEGDLPRTIQSHHVDGVICVAPILPALGARLSACRMPAVVLDSGARESGVDAAIRPDGSAGIALATRHLITLGHSRLAYLRTPPDDASHRERWQACTDTLHSHGLPVIEEYAESVWRQELAGESLSRILARDPHYRATGRPGFTAVVCHNDIMGMAAVRYLQEVGLRVPEDISITGFDDLSLQYGFEPAITSVAFDRREMGRRAVAILNEGLDHGAGPHQEILPVSLAVRGSTAPPVLSG